MRVVWSGIWNYVLNKTNTPYTNILLNTFNKPDPISEWFPAKIKPIIHSQPDSLFQAWVMTALINNMGKLYGPDS